MQVSVDSQIKKIIADLNAMPDQVQQASIFALNRTAECDRGYLRTYIIERRITRTGENFGLSIARKFFPKINAIHMQWKEFVIT